jgi:chorismate dehydratase
MTEAASIRLGAVGYLNTRPLVCGLSTSPIFDLRFDVPSRCADLLHEGAIDLGLIPSIEYWRRWAASADAIAGPPRRRYLAVPGLSIASRGPVASVCVYTRRPVREIRSIAMDTSSRTSVALVQVLCTRQFRVQPSFEPHGPDLDAMLDRCDAALLIGDNALFDDKPRVGVERIDLGEAWTTMTGLPFVWAFWAGRENAVDAEGVRALQQARDEGIRHVDDIARAYCPGSPERQALAASYLRDNIHYTFGPDEAAGLALFYRYASDAGLVEAVDDVRFFAGRAGAGRR